MESTTKYIPRAIAKARSETERERLIQETIGLFICGTNHSRSAEYLMYWHCLKARHARAIVALAEERFRTILGTTADLGLPILDLKPIIARLTLLKLQFVQKEAAA